MTSSETLEERKLRQASYVQKWRKNNPERQALARKRAYANRKLKAIKMVGDPICIKCGCDDIDFLEFNHKNGGGSLEYRESGRMSMMDRILTFKRPVDDLEITCRVCNTLHYLNMKKPESAQKYKIEWK